MPRQTDKRRTQPTVHSISEHLQPRILSAEADWDCEKHLRIQLAKNPLPNGTLGAVGLTVRVTGPREFPTTILRLPVEPRALIGIDAASVRMFRWDTDGRNFKPLWNSGINVAFGFAWCKLHRPGTYMPIGLVRDRLLQEALLEMAQQRRLADGDSAEQMQAITRQALESILNTSDADLEELRRFIMLLEVQTGLGNFAAGEIQRGGGANLLPFPLPGNVSIAKFRTQLLKLTTPSEGLPEEALFFPPQVVRDGEPPWPRPPTAWEGVEPRTLERLRLSQEYEILRRLPRWCFSQDWWMYHHDDQHTGHASGSSNINSTNVGSLIRWRTVPVDGQVASIPCVVAGKVYVGTTNRPGGSLYEIDLMTGTAGIIYSYAPQLGGGSNQGLDGIGSSPAIVGSRAYFSALDGRVFCVDISTHSLVWVTNLRYPDVDSTNPALGRNQPVNNPQASCWTSPLVVNGKVYVGLGEGEAGAFGFVYCLAASTGRVVWLYCTNQFSTAVENSPNVVPSSTVVGSLPPGFTSLADPAQRGASVWSSCAYDRGLNRIFVGTGNAFPDDPLPDPRYASGVLSLDADTGQFRAFFQPTPADSYRANDDDVDVPSSPTIFTRNGTRMVGIGSKNGSYFLLDANTLTPLARRQLLPNDALTNAPLPTVDLHGNPGENAFGVFGTAAVDWGRRVLYVGLGGYDGLDAPTTPFIRALNWADLSDAWPTAVQAVGGNQVSRYTAATPPMYLTSEAGVSSPAVVNDVVFVSTTRTALYALDAATGACLWSAPGLPAGGWAMGPAIYGNYVVIGAGNNVYIYTFGFRIPRPPIVINPWWWLLKNLPWPPPPPPDPWIQQELGQIAAEEQM